MIYLSIFIQQILFYLDLQIQRKRKKKLILVMTLIVITVFIALRKNFPDQDSYEYAFKLVPSFLEISSKDTPVGYVELGYWYLASFIKMIANNTTFYLLAMGALSMFLLYKTLNTYCILPLIGLANYIGRFLINRDFIQIRSSLAILLIMLASKYLLKHQYIKYLLVILLAYQFHHLAFIALPFIFIYKYQPSNKTIIISLIVAAILSQFAMQSISSVVDSWSQDLNYETYTQHEYVEQALGLSNPVIYWQVFILGLFMIKEKDISQQTPYYKFLRSGYFYSTLILILFCNYTALSGRTSTLFATFEIFIIPLIINNSKNISKNLLSLFFAIMFSYFLYAKYTETMQRILLEI
ncbi:EpsG family protein [Hoylesella nanceiensis]|jgi:hypothetical protein|uniref:EpsG family protein n=1 Tax=Hoylesella nanceiensis TaxID=425941 RepID=UPI0028EE151F|nr:EpsG family protein [Hoylesella nanceiensis]